MTHKAHSLNEMGANRSRLRRGIALPALVALGLGSRADALPEWVKAYVGDVLWGAFFYLIFATIFLTWPRRRLWLAATVTTEAIELSQLYRAPWAEQLRATRLGALLLGRGFLWSDVVCVALGATLAYAAHTSLERPRVTKG